MGNVLSYFSSIMGSKSREAPTDPGPLTGTRVEPPQPAPQAPVDIDEIALGLKSTLITSRDQWDKMIESATEEPAEIPVITMHLQLRAHTASSNPELTSSAGSCGYLCVREEGRVCYDGKENAVNTIFKVSRVYPPPIDKYQFVCTGGPSKNFVLYPEGTELKSKRFDADKDYACKDTAEPTLMSVEINDDGLFLVTLESRHGVVSGKDSEPIKFIPYFAEHLERELAPL